MLADILFIVYLVFMIIITVAAIDPQLIELQQEFMAFKATKHFMLEQGVRWP